MNCFNSTSPINIDIDNISGKCDAKCSFTMNYTNSSCIVTNKGDYILLNYDSSKNPPVLYNGAKYNVKEVRIYFPSLHEYAGFSSDAEMIIVHNSTIKAKGLLVCVPIKFLSDETQIDDPVRREGALFLNEVCETLSTNAPNFGEKSNVSSKYNYNLDNFVPKKAFFSYTSNEPFEPCAGKNDFVVFDVNEWYITMFENSYAKIENIISNHSVDVVEDDDVKLFYNSKGPVPGSEQIYIDCQPVGQSAEMVMVREDQVEDEEDLVPKEKEPLTLEKILKNPFIGIILGLFLTFVVIYLLNIIFKTTNGKDVIPLGNGLGLNGGPK
jgi:carbonic anhydrase